MSLVNRTKSEQSVALYLSFKVLSIFKHRSQETQSQNWWNLIKYFFYKHIRNRFYQNLIWNVGSTLTYIIFFPPFKQFWLIYFGCHNTVAHQISLKILTCIFKTKKSKFTLSFDDTPIHTIFVSCLFDLVFNDDDYDIVWYSKERVSVVK